MLISESYKKLNETLHKENRFFGGKGYKLAADVFFKLIKKYTVEELLDYGCGKGALGKTLNETYGFPAVVYYDPCVEEYSHKPEGQFDGVVCNDVLEHVEPEFIDDVLTDIYNLGSRVYYFSISLSPSNKFLPDCRNAHLIIEPSAWWKKKLEDTGFEILDTLETEKGNDNPKLLFYRLVAKKRYRDGN